MKSIWVKSMCKKSFWVILCEESLGEKYIGEKYMGEKSVG